MAKFEQNEFHYRQAKFLNLTVMRFNLSLQLTT